MKLMANESKSVTQQDYWQIQMWENRLYQHLNNEIQGNEDKSRNSTRKMGSGLWDEMVFRLRQVNSKYEAESAHFF